MAIRVLTRYFVAVNCDRKNANARDTMPKSILQKRGRPSLPAGERKLASVAFRPAPHLKERLESEAALHSVPLSREIEERLAESFRGEEAFGGKNQYRLMQLLAVAAAHVERLTGKKWTEDYATFFSVDQAWR